MPFCRILGAILVVHPTKRVVLQTPEHRKFRLFAFGIRSASCSVSPEARRCPDVHMIGTLELLTDFGVRSRKRTVPPRSHSASGRHDSEKTYDNLPRIVVFASVEGTRHSRTTCSLPSVSHD